MHYTIMINSQRLKLIDLNVRELADRIIEVQGIQNSYDKYRGVKKTVWTCLEFDNCFSVEQYLTSGKNPKFGKKVKFTHEGDVFSHYDSRGRLSVFFYNNYDKDFDRTPSIDVGFNKEAMRKYNEAHPISKTKPKTEPNPKPKSIKEKK